MKRRLIYALSALAMAATMLITSCGKSDEVVDPTPAPETNVGSVTINGVTKPFTGVAKAVLEPTFPPALVFSGSRSQADVEDGTLFQDFETHSEDLKWSGYFTSTIVTNFELSEMMPEPKDLEPSKTPDPEVMFGLVLMSEDCIYSVLYNVEGSGEFRASYSYEGGGSKLYLKGGNLSYNLDGDKITLDLNLQLSGGHSIQLVCDGDVPFMYMPTLVDEIKLDKEEMTLKVGEEGKISITDILPENADNKEVEWKSSNEDVATVDQEGNVTALKEGTAYISVESLDGGDYVECVVKVEAAEVEKVAVTGVTLNFSGTIGLWDHSSCELIATVSPSDATNKAVTWKSSDTNVLTVNDEGYVEAVAGADGTAEVTVTTEDGEFEAVCSFNVAPYVDNVSLNKSTLSLKKGESESLIATISPSDAVNKNVVWESSNTDVATVDDKGEVTAVADGTATITVTTDSGSRTATCEVTVGLSLASVNADSIPEGDEWVIEDTDETAGDEEKFAGLRAALAALDSSRTVDVVFPNLTVLPEFALYNCEAVAKWTFSAPEVTTVDGMVFFYADNITKIDLPKATTIAYGLCNVETLVSLTIAKYERVVSTHENTFVNTPIANIDLTTHESNVDGLNFKYANVGSKGPFKSINGVTAE